MCADGLPAPSGHMATSSSQEHTSQSDGGVKPGLSGSRLKDSREGVLISPTRLYTCPCIKGVRHEDLLILGLPSGPVVKTPSFHGRAHWFDLWGMIIPHGSQCSQITCQIKFN